MLLVIGKAAVLEALVVFSYCFSHSKTVYCLSQINANYPIDLPRLFHCTKRARTHAYMHLRWLQISSTALIKVSLWLGWSPFLFHLLCTKSINAANTFCSVWVHLLLPLIDHHHHHHWNEQGCWNPRVACIVTSSIRPSGNQLCKTIAGFALTTGTALRVIGNICGKYDHKCNVRKLCINTACFCWWHFLVVARALVHS